MKIKKGFMDIGGSGPQRLSDFGSTSLEAFGPSFRVLVWNIYKGKKKRWPHDFQSLIVDRDLVLLQEAVINAPSDRLFFEHDRMKWVMGRSHRHPLHGIDTGVKTGSRVEPLSRELIVSSFSEPLVKTRKLMLLTEYPLAERRDRLLVINMHAINFVSLQKYLSQLEQLGEALSGHNGPILLGGDFNTWHTTRMRHFRGICAEAGLVTAQWERRSQLSHLNHHIDHVAFRGISLQRVETLHHISSSDHKPIAATFALD